MPRVLPQGNGGTAGFALLVVLYCALVLYFAVRGGGEALCGVGCQGLWQTGPGTTVLKELVEP
jgi:hypothetical protein